MGNATKIIGHRGYSEKYPENTILSFEKAIEAGADTIEFDVHETEEGVLVIHHDVSLEDTDTGHGYIYNSQFSYINTLTVSGEKIPTLQQILDTFLHISVGFEIELKGFSDKFVDSVLKETKEKALLSRIEFTSSSIPLILYIKSLEPQAKIGLFVNKLPSWMPLELGQKKAVADMRFGKFSVGHFPLDFLTSNYVKSLQNEGILVHAADCNTEDDLKKAFDLDVDQLSTNRVELAKKIRDNLL